MGSTLVGTVMVKDINPGTRSSDPIKLTEADGTLFFTADDGVHAVELWKSDGTEAGTAMVEDITPGERSSLLYHLTNVNGTLFFRAGNHELWKAE